MPFCTHIILCNTSAYLLDFPSMALVEMAQSSAGSHCCLFPAPCLSPGSSLQLLQLRSPSCLASSKAWKFCVGPDPMIRIRADSFLENKQNLVLSPLFCYIFSPYNRPSEFLSWLKPTRLNFIFFTALIFLLPYSDFYLTALVIRPKGQAAMKKSSKLKKMSKHSSQLFLLMKQHSTPHFSLPQSPF